MRILTVAAILASITVIGQDDHTKELKKRLEDLQRMAKEIEMKQAEIKKMLQEKPDAGALEDLERAIKKEPENAELYLKRAHARKEMGQFDQAKEDYERALKLNPHLADKMEPGTEPIEPKFPPREAIEEVIEFQKNINPELHQRLRELMESGKKDEFMQYFMRAMEATQRLKELAKINPDEYAFATKVWRLDWMRDEMVRKYHEADDEARKEIKTHMREIVNQLFVMHQEKGKAESQEIKERLEMLNKKLKEREENKEKMIEEQLKMMTEPPKHHEK